jgi:hypothetical protein
MRPCEAAQALDGRLGSGEGGRTTQMAALTQEQRTRERSQARRWL